MPLPKQHTYPPSIFLSHHLSFTTFLHMSSLLFIFIFIFSHRPIIIHKSTLFPTRSIHLKHKHKTTERKAAKMASQQQRRENTTHEREIHVEKDIVPKLTNRFEELAHHTATDAAATQDTDKGSTVVVVGATVGHALGTGDQARKGEVRESGKAERGTHFESISDKVAGLEFGAGHERTGSDQESVKRERERHRHVEQERVRAMEEKNRQQREREMEQHRKVEQQQQQHQQQKEKSSVQQMQRQGEREREKGPTSVGKFEMSHEQEKLGSQGKGGERQQGVKQQGGQQHQEKQQGGKQHQEKNQIPSLEEISEYRQTAQQNSMEAIQAAQER